MHILIIEDETLMAEELRYQVQATVTQPCEIAIAHSVQQALHYLREVREPDLVFSDIDLGDGVCFDIFSQVTLQAPVIYCTGFNHYAREAFSGNGIGYLLKPYSGQQVAEALRRFFLQKNMAQKNGAGKDRTLLVSWKNKIIPLRVADVSFFFIENKLTYLTTRDGSNYYISQPLDELEQWCGDLFFRANRQYLVNRDAIIELQYYQSRKLLVQLKSGEGHEVLVGKNNIRSFLDWLRN